MHMYFARYNYNMIIALISIIKVTILKCEGFPIMDQLMFKRKHGKALGFCWVSQSLSVHTSVRVVFKATNYVLERDYFAFVHFRKTAALQTVYSCCNPAVLYI